MPGWYPDPAGAPGRFRYWDGQGWSTTTTADARDPAPGSGAVGSAQVQGRRPRRWIIAGVVALVVILVGAFAVNAVIVSSAVDAPQPSTSLPGGGDSAAPSGAPSAVPSTPEPSDPEPTAVPSQPTPTAAPPSVGPTPPPATPSSCPPGNPTARQPSVGDGRIHGGNLSFARQSNYLVDPPNDQLSWAYDVGSQSRLVQPTWTSSYAVGALLTMDGFEAPKIAAQLAMACTAPSELYVGFTGRNDLFSKAIKVDGRPAWAIRSEIRVDTDKTTLPGDVVEIIVVDADSPESLSLFWACVPIGDQAALSQLDRVVKSLRVT